MKKVILLALLLGFSNQSLAQDFAYQAKIKEGLKLEEKMLGAIIMVSTLGPQVGKIEFKPDSILWKYLALKRSEVKGDMDFWALPSSLFGSIAFINYADAGQTLGALINPKNIFLVEDKSSFGISSWVSFSASSSIILNSVTQKVTAWNVVRMMERDQNIDHALDINIQPWANILGFKNNEVGRIKIAVKNEWARQILERSGSYGTNSIHYTVDLLKIFSQLNLVSESTVTETKRIISNITPSDKAKTMSLDDLYNIDLRLAERLCEDLGIILQNPSLVDSQRHDLTLELEALNRVILAAKAFQGAMN